MMYSLAEVSFRRQYESLERFGPYKQKDVSSILIFIMKLYYDDLHEQSFLAQELLVEKGELYAVKLITLELLENEMFDVIIY